jgi:hypothetical protein
MARGFCAGWGDRLSIEWYHAREKVAITFSESRDDDRLRAFRRLLELSAQRICNLTKWSQLPRRTGQTEVDTTEPVR